MVGSRMRSRSKPARLARMWNSSRPAAVSVSIASVREAKPMPNPEVRLELIDAAELTDTLGLHQRVARRR